MAGYAPRPLSYSNERRNLLNELKVTINKAELSIKEYQGQRVVTLKEIDTVHERPEGTARRNFNANRGRFIEGEDFFKITADEIRTHKILDLSPKAHEDITLITESGYLMLVKSFTDDLAWKVQRQLVNVYFRSTAEQRRAAAQDTEKGVLAEAKLNNSRARLAAEWRKLAEKNPVPEYQQICQHYASAALAGREVLPLPAASERTYSAEEVGDLLGGISANKIGRAANQNGLKTPEYGIQVWDKSRHSSKQVPSWRYNEKAVERLREILKPFI